MECGGLPAASLVAAADFGGPLLATICLTR